MSNAETQELFAVEGLVDGKWVAQWPICDSEEGARATFGMYGEGAQLRVARFVREEAQLANTEQSEPVAWVLTEQLERRETTTRGYLWFSDPANCMWTPLCIHPAAAPKPASAASAQAKEGKSHD